MESFMSKDVLCPYYLKDEDNHIVCEGTELDTSVHLTCSNKKHRREYQKFYCCNHYKKCRIANMLDRKWEVDQ